MSQTSTAGSCPPNLKWQWADRGWLFGQDRLNFVLGLNKGTVKGFQEQRADLGHKSFRITGAAEITELRPTADHSPTWTGTEGTFGSTRRSRLSCVDKKTKSLQEASAEPVWPKKPRGGAGHHRNAPPLGEAMRKSSSLPRLLPTSKAKVLARDRSEGAGEGGDSIFFGDLGGSGFPEDGFAESGGLGESGAMSRSRVSFRTPPPATPSLPPPSARSSQAAPPSESGSGVKVLAAPCLMNLYDGLGDWRPKWEKQPYSKVKSTRPAPPFRKFVPDPNRETAEEISRRLAEIKMSTGQGYAIPKAVKEEHQSSMRSTAFDFAGCIRYHKK